MSIPTREAATPRTGLKPWEFPEPDWTEESWDEFVAWNTLMRTRDAIPVHRCSGSCHRLIHVGTAPSHKLGKLGISKTYCVTCFDPEHQRKEAEMRDVQLDWRKLQKLLKEQGFTIERTKMGWRIKPPTGEGMVHLHESSVETTGRTNLNVLHQLYSLGFKDQATWKKHKVAEGRNPEEFPYECQFDGCSERFKMAAHRANHEKKCAWNPARAVEPIPATSTKAGKPAAGPVTIHSIGEFAASHAPDPSLHPSLQAAVNRANGRLSKELVSRELGRTEDITLQQAIDRILSEHDAVQSVIDQNAALIQENKKLRERLEKFTALIQEGVDLVE